MIPELDSRLTNKNIIETSIIYRYNVGLLL